MASNRKIRGGRRHWNANCTCHKKSSKTIDFYYIIISKNKHFSSRKINEKYFWESVVVDIRHFDSAFLSFPVDDGGLHARFSLDLSAGICVSCDVTYTYFEHYHMIRLRKLLFSWVKAVLGLVRWLLTWPLRPAFSFARWMPLFSPLYGFISCCSFTVFAFCVFNNCWTL